jgi:hypothetical protein
MSKVWPVQDLHPEESLERNARKILRVRVGEFYSYEPIIRDVDAVTDLHNMRIASKRLRYTLELFRAVFGEPGEHNIDRVKALQEELGQIHDGDVRIELIKRELVLLAGEQTDDLARAFWATPAESHPDVIEAAMRPPQNDPRVGLIALLGRATAARTHHYAEFIKLWDQYAAAGMREDLVSLSATPSSRD